MIEKGGVMRLARVGGAVVCLCLLPWSAAAQGTPISEILPKLIQADIRLATPPPGTPFASHDAHFIPGEQEQLVPYLFNQSILSQLTTFPLGSSSGGFTYSLDPSLGTWTRSTNSFGPAFAEASVDDRPSEGQLRLPTISIRPTTTQRRPRASMMAASGFYLTHKPVVRAGSFEGDVIRPRSDSICQPTPSRCLPTTASPTNWMLASPCRSSRWTWMRRSTRRS